MDKTRLLILAQLLLAIGGFLVLSQQARAGDEASFDIEPKFQAKIAKEKSKRLTIQNTLGDAGQGMGANPDCGSQSIGNVNTGGRIGAAPREIFVFAPNAINLVSGQGCK